MGLGCEAAAEYLGIAASTLEKMRCAGTGPEFEKVGKKAIVYSVAALENYLAQRRAHSTSEAETPAPRHDRRERDRPDPADLLSSSVGLKSEVDTPIRRHRYRDTNELNAENPAKTAVSPAEPPLKGRR